jgi:transposase
MHQGQYVFSQIMESVIRHDFNQFVSRYHGEHRVKQFTCWEQFLSMSFGQLSFRESLRDIVVCLGAQRHKLYHLGFRSPVRLPTLARANEKRDWRIYRDYAEILIKEARNLHIDDAPAILDLEEAVYAIDSTTIELCLHIFPWARLKKKRASIKLNIGLELKGNIPAFFDISSGKEHDVHFMDRLEYEAGNYYVLDRGYVDFKRLHTMHRTGAFFVTRAKNNMVFRRLYSHRVDKTSGVKCDQTILLMGYQTAQSYPEKLRRIKYIDVETGQVYIFLTNQFDVEAKTIAELYKNRWQVELFFKWIKQHLSVKSFWGRSANAVKTQICIALCAYLLVAMMKKKLKIERSSYEILQILSVSLFDKTPMMSLVSEFILQGQEQNTQKQAMLWDY